MTSTTDHCGTCTACIDACPTNAIVEPYKVDGSRCISYLTIELKENMPEYAKDSYDKWIFGCDIVRMSAPGISFLSLIMSLYLMLMKSFYQCLKMNG